MVSAAVSVTLQGSTALHNSVVAAAAVSLWHKEVPQASTMRSLASMRVRLVALTTCPQEAAPGGTGLEKVHQWERVSR